MLKKCKYCGTLNFENAVNCVSCGKQLTDALIQSVQEEKPKIEEKKEPVKVVSIISEKEEKKKPVVTVIREKKPDSKKGKNKNASEMNLKKDFVPIVSIIKKEEPKSAESVTEQQTKIEKEKKKFKTLNWKQSIIAGIILGLSLVTAVPGCIHSDEDQNGKVTPVTSVVSAENEKKTTDKKQSETGTYSIPKSMSEIPDKLKEEIISELDDTATAYAAKHGTEDPYTVECAGAVGEYYLSAKVEEDSGTNRYGRIYKFSAVRTGEYSNGETESFYKAFEAEKLSVNGNKYRGLDLGNIITKVGNEKVLMFNSFSTYEYNSYETLDDLKKDILDTKVDKYKVEFNDIE